MKEFIVPKIEIKKFSFKDILTVSEPLINDTESISSGVATFDGSYNVNKGSFEF